METTMYVIVATLMALASASGWARETRPICARYETQSGWSQGYKVKAHLYAGRELNQATSTLYYDYTTNYVVIFWREGQATIIDVGYARRFPSYMTIDGNDQQGRKWEISSETYSCY